MGLTTAAANRILEREPWARERLARFSGRTFAVRVGPLTSSLRIDPRGLLQASPIAGSVPDLSLSMSPLDLPAMLADPKRWNEFVTEDGDSELAAALKDLAQTLPWFVERGLARTLGPIVAQRIADAGRVALTFPEYAATRVASNFGTYARDEAQFLAHPADMRTLADDTMSLSARIDALDARVASLAGRFPEPPR
ncbi:MAG TPA: SCP2 sterol-binding domain-containing protein [Casimicrobiaceae bacterium]|nr:SCP2 sterol-binding domain-containing protein [Casimicrobiaceae bacterium]